jgi:hypothetical protein
MFWFLTAQRYRDGWAETERADPGRGQLSSPSRAMHEPDYELLLCLFRLF